MIAVAAVTTAALALANPGQLLVLPGGDLLVAERAGRDRILRVQPRTGAIRVFATGIPEPFGLLRRPDGSFLVSGTAGIYAVAAAGGRARLQSRADAGPLALGVDGTVYYANRAEVGRIDPATGKATRFAVDVDIPHGLGLRPDGKLVVSDTGHRRLLLVDPASGTSRVLATGFVTPLGIALDGSDVLVADYGTGRLVRVNPSGRRTPLANGLRKPYAVALGSGGIAYVVEAGDVTRPTGGIARVTAAGAVSRL